MKQVLLQEKYPVFEMELNRSETTFGSVTEIVDYLKQKVEMHPAARFIAVFDHYAHTKALEKGEIGDDIREAKNIVFCFGVALPTPRVMAVRPRSIGVTETRSGFVINFLEAPMPIANTAMEAWTLALRNVKKAESE